MPRRSTTFNFQPFKPKLLSQGSSGRCRHFGQGAARGCSVLHSLCSVLCCAAPCSMLHTLCFLLHALLLQVPYSIFHTPLFHAPLFCASSPLPCCSIVPCPIAALLPAPCSLLQVSCSLFHTPCSLLHVPLLHFSMLHCCISPLSLLHDSCSTGCRVGTAASPEHHTLILLLLLALQTSPVLPLWGSLSSGQWAQVDGVAGVAGGRAVKASAPEFWLLAPSPGRLPACPAEPQHISVLLALQQGCNIISSKWLSVCHL